MIFNLVSVNLQSAVLHSAKDISVDNLWKLNADMTPDLPFSFHLLLWHSAKNFGKRKFSITTFQQNDGSSS